MHPISTWQSPEVKRLEGESPIQWNKCESEKNKCIHEQLLSVARV